jgi:hypothetical protein
MMGFDRLGWLHRCLQRVKGKKGDAYREGRVTASSEDYSADGYESPRLLVIGGVRKFSTGSSSSGKADANSQYYW